LSRLRLRRRGCEERFWNGGGRALSEWDRGLRAAFCCEMKKITDPEASCIAWLAFMALGKRELRFGERQQG
jgi:hypothetical protein